MITPHYGFDAGKVAGNTLQAGEVDWLFGIVDSQLGGALQAIGAGVLVNPADVDPDSLTGLLVTNVGGGIGVAPGAAVCVETTNGYGYIFAVLATAATIDGSQFADGDNWVFLVPQYLAPGGSLDTRTGARPIIEIRNSDSSTGDGAALLAYVANAGGTLTITDSRNFVPLATLFSRIAQIVSDIGYDSTARTKGSANARLEALESAPGGSGGGGATYLTQMAVSPSDATSAKTYIDTQIAALAATVTAQIASGGQVPAPTRTGNLAHRVAVLTTLMREVNTAGVEEIEGAYVLGGVGGDGTAGTANHVLGTTLVQDDRGWSPS